MYVLIHITRGVRNCDFKVKKQVSRVKFKDLYFLTVTVVFICNFCHKTKLRVEYLCIFN